MNDSARTLHLIRDRLAVAGATAPLVCVLIYSAASVQSFPGGMLGNVALVFGSFLIGLTLRGASRAARLKKPEDMLTRTTTAEPPVEDRQDFFFMIDRFLAANLGSETAAAYLSFALADPSRQLADLTERERQRLTWHIIQAVRARVRASDLICNVGGNEVAVFLPGAGEMRLSRLAASIAADVLKSTSHLTADRRGASLLAGHALGVRGDKAGTLRQKALSRMDAPELASATPAKTGKFGKAG